LDPARPLLDLVFTDDDPETWSEKVTGVLNSYSYDPASPPVVPRIPELCMSRWGTNDPKVVGDDRDDDAASGELMQDRRTPTRRLTYLQYSSSNPVTSGSSS
jgi:hypothetical protein